MQTAEHSPFCPGRYFVREDPLTTDDARNYWVNCSGECLDA